jgi:hypothetical protein
MRWAAGLPSIALPFAQEPAITVQLQASSRACWDARYPAPAVRDDATRFIDDAP